MVGLPHRHVIVDTGGYTFEGYISPIADLDDRFRMELDDGEVIYINGWLVDSIEDVDPGRSCCNGCGCAGCEPYESTEVIANMVRETPCAWGMDRGG